ncbi:hypothetical protein Xcel_3122 [Xylanimonas cellulosilytica DSM 15894]|uniref:Uncharacterized protein n=1 Tax=Xylanimonas cellulosilytica (strain DSM 15894 / JCM 12276 / CECT 5975 / KCTC 9989 / LMG 20990 / NBRC 107835 / XIL07) TaxID=446471 RepID=D1BZZ5_XYLCX|nr:hypothetical protein [Xylanimonas cellulosilytica]ACZ32123.1 hypothetical protein Xcel_3122 [Xylanimonas cellulosilytica DSM 15894]
MTLTVNHRSDPPDAAVYVAPRVELMASPRALTTFDGFVVSGCAFGSEVEGVEVEVSVAGVTRTGVVEAGHWTVAFEDGALSHRHAGVRAVTARLIDAWFNPAQVTEWVTVDEFVDGFVHVDGGHDLEGEVGPGGTLVATGELGLGTHEQGRELVVMLVRDDDEAVVVSTGLVEAGWHHGEWVARLPLCAVGRGTYRIRALLTDKVCASLTRLAVGRPFRLA